MTFKRLLHILTLPTVCTLLCCISTGCFTGIESTRQIELSRQDRKLLEVSPEEQLFASVVGLPLDSWPEGFRFIVTDPRASRVYASFMAADSLQVGDSLHFLGITPVSRPDGKEYVRLLFAGPNNLRFSYDTGKESSASSEITSDKLPMLVNARMVAQADSLLCNREIWNRSSMAYTPDGERISVKKFSRFLVDSVTAGQGFFPLRLWATFNSDDIVTPHSVGSHNSVGSHPIFFYLDFSSSLAESRPPARVLSLSDPKLKYPAITDTVWQTIRKGMVMQGMTKDECRLSLGNPSDANTGHDYNSTIDLWQYPDGTFLRFIDGLLHSFRK